MLLGISQADDKSISDDTHFGVTLHPDPTPPLLAYGKFHPKGASLNMNKRNYDCVTVHYTSALH